MGTRKTNGGALVNRLAQNETHGAFFHRSASPSGERYKGNNFPSQSTITIRHLVASLARRALLPAHWARKTHGKPASGGWAQLHRLHAIAPSLTNVELQITSTERQPQFLSWAYEYVQDLSDSTGRAASVRPGTWSECHNSVSFGLSQPRFRFPAPILLGGGGGECRKPMLGVASWGQVELQALVMVYNNPFSYHCHIYISGYAKWSPQTPNTRWFTTAFHYGGRCRKARVGMRGLRKTINK